MKRVLAVLMVASGLVPSAQASTEQSLILFESDRAGNRDVWVMLPDGTEPRRLTDSPAADQGPVWSPDGQRIAFFTRRDGDADIWTMTTDGDEHDPHRLTDNDANDMYPVWSPTGRIAFISDGALDAGGTFEIYSMEPDGTDVRRLTHNSWNDMYPAWSADGSRVLFSAPDPLGMTTDIYSMAADGSDVRRLTDNLCEDHAPAASPDGHSIAYSSACGTDGTSPARLYWAIAVMDVNGGPPRFVIDEPLANEDWPTWSPDSSQIVFASTRDGDQLFGMDIVVAAADGSVARNITQTPSAFDGLPWFRPNAPAPQPDIVGTGHIIAGGPWVQGRSATVLTDADSVDGFFTELADRAEPGDRLHAFVTRNGSGAPYALSMNFHGSKETQLGREWLGGCTGELVSARLELDLFAEATCPVPTGATTVEVTAFYGADLTVGIERL